ncbi:MAG: leucine-rich repeat domain-containing protein [Muribaculaceae bacterium]|nr:leucine-rich repeat domain-containing protein [Muribaculaceae bacterium]
MKRFKITMAIAAVVAMWAGAYEIESGGLHYEIDAENGTAVLVSHIVDGINRYNGEVVVPEAVYCDGRNYEVTAVGEGAFAGSAVTLVQLPGSVRQIGKGAFAGARELQGLTLPMGLERLSERALAGTALTAVVLPEGLTTVGGEAFAGCAALHTLLLPSTLDSIGPGALDGCYNLFEIYAAGNVAPRFAGSDDVNAVDVIVAPGAVTAFEDDETWGGDSDRFVVWAAEEDSWYDIHVGELGDGSSVSRLVAETEEPSPFGLHGVSLAGDVAFRVLDKWGETVAVTAAPRYYLPQGEIAETYTIVPTVMMSDLEPVAYTVPAAPVVTGVSDEMYPAAEPQVVVHDGTVYINNLPHEGWVRVFDAYGRQYYERPAAQVTNIGNLPENRVYIVMVGNHATKIAL